MCRAKCNYERSLLGNARPTGSTEYRETQTGNRDAQVWRDAGTVGEIGKANGEKLNHSELKVLMA